MRFTASNYYKYGLLNAEIDWNAPDAFKYVLMREGYVYSATCGLLACLSASRATSVTFSYGAQTISRATGSWVTDNFVVGSRIYTTDSGANVGPFLIASVTALTLTVTDTDGTLANMTDRTTACTVYSYDDLPTGSGYTSGGTALAGENSGTITGGATGVWTDFDITASGGDIGPTRGFLIFDDTTTSNYIVGFFDFEVDVTIADGTTLHVNSGYVSHI